MGEPNPPTPIWRPALAAAGLAAAARALLAALQDRYLAAGLWGVGAGSLARDLLVAMLFALPAAWLLCALGRRLELRGARLVLGGAAGVLVALFVLHRLPSVPAYVPGTDGALGLGAHGAALLAAVVVAARLVLAMGQTRGSRSPWPVRLLDGAGMASVLAAGLALGVDAATSTDGARPNVVLISVDTLRADRLGCYGYDRPTSPVIDAFAERAVRFENAYTSRSWTLAAHMSLLTSLQPSVHTVDKQRSLPFGIETLQEAFHTYGYVTAGIVDSIVWLAPRYGFDRGFDVYKPMYGNAGPKIEATARLLDDVGDRPFFLFLHFYDVHSDTRELPYEADPEDLEAFAGWYEGSLRFEPGTSAMTALTQRKSPLEGDDLRYLESLYDAGLRSMDRHLGVLFHALTERGLDEDTIIVLTSDHGEEFYDHGAPGHGQAYRECQAVPLLVRTPEMDAGRTSGAWVELLDIGPTLAELCGVGFDGGQGQSFADIVRGGPDRAGRTAILQDQSNDALGIRTRAANLLWKPSRYEVFDLTVDPGEQDDLLAGGREGSLLDELMELVEAERETSARWRRRLGIEVQGEGEAGSLLQDDEVEKLRALGYLGDH